MRLCRGSVAVDSGSQDCMAVTFVAPYMLVVRTSHHLQGVSQRRHSPELSMKVLDSLGSFKK